MKIITFVGTGNAWNHKHGNCAALLQFNRTNLLLDCGPTAPAYIEQIMSLNKLENIWISHMHGDHIYGLEEIAFKNKFMFGGRKINLYIQEELLPWLRQCLESTLQFNKEKPLALEDYYNIITYKSILNINGELFSIERTKHVDTMPSFMIRGDNFIYTADTQFIDWTKNDLKGINNIFHDIQFNKFGDDVHAPLEDIAKLPDEIKAKIWCMHYSTNIEDHADELEDNLINIVKSFEKITLK